MGAAGDLGPHEGRLRVEDLGVDLLQALPAVVVVAVARGGGEVVRPQFRLLHRKEDLQLVGLRHLVDGLEAVLQSGQDRLSTGKKGLAEPQTLVLLDKFHEFPSFCIIFLQQSTIYGRDLQGQKHGGLSNP